MAFQKDLSIRHFSSKHPHCRVSSHFSSLKSFFKSQRNMGKLFPRLFGKYSASVFCRFWKYSNLYPKQWLLNEHITCKTRWSTNTDWKIKIICNPIIQKLSVFFPIHISIYNDFRITYMYNFKSCISFYMNISPHHSIFKNFGSENTIEWVENNSLHIVP